MVEVVLVGVVVVVVVVEVEVVEVEEVEVDVVEVEGPPGSLHRAATQCNRHYGPSGSSVGTPPGGHESPNLTLRPKVMFCVNQFWDIKLSFQVIVVGHESAMATLPWTVQAARVPAPSVLTTVGGVRPQTRVVDVMSNVPERCCKGGYRERG